ncbi:MAG: hypothetical protein PSN37_06145 [Alphaproteobacteria bacterium]|nr:hypothetical protein [Alphaproteobacteria bacterium]
MKGALPIAETPAFKTRREGIYAVGETHIYPEKRKLILSSFYEAALNGHMPLTDTPHSEQKLPWNS